MSKIILAIHGLGNKPPEELLKKWWLNSIEEGLAGIGKSIPDIPLKMIYWSDILHPQPLDIDEQDPKSPLYLEEPYTPAGTTIKPAPKKLLTKLFASVEQQLDRIFLNDDMSLNFEKVTNRIIHNYFEDLETYYLTANTVNENPTVRETICERLRLALNKYQNYDILILSHSMGTIVSFDVLSSLKHPKQINTLITVGSPLGLPVIVSRIFSEQNQKRNNTGKAKAPDSIGKKWYNISDMEDMVALDHTLKDDFEANRNGVKAEDFFVYNNYEINGERNAHKIYGYLRTPELANIIASFLLEPEPGWFRQLYSRIRTMNKLRVPNLNPFKPRGSQS